jgi:hypothetical protein
MSDNPQTYHDVVIGYLVAALTQAVYRISFLEAPAPIAPIDVAVDALENARRLLLRLGVPADDWRPTGPSVTIDLEVKATPEELAEAAVRLGIRDRNASDKP